MSRDDRGRNTLVALGTAAVLAVYAAGFDRTKAAAQRFAEADAAQRRPAPPSARMGDTLIAAPAPRDTAKITPSNTTSSNRPLSSNPLSNAPTVASVDAGKRAPSGGVASPRTPRDTTTPLPEKPSTPVPVPVADSAAKSDTAQPAKERGPYKDGTYYGWGTSRHGDIQAGIEITNGKISAAWIEQCLTRYSCSWIAALPRQVELRQSPETDFVSGATQSTNAFYYGVVQALSKAK